MVPHYTISTNIWKGLEKVHLPLGRDTMYFPTAGQAKNLCITLFTHQTIT